MYKKKNNKCKSSNVTTSLKFKHNISNRYNYKKRNKQFETKKNHNGKKLINILERKKMQQ